MPTQLSLTALDSVVCVVTLVGSMLLGLWLGLRKSSSGSSAGFFLAGRQLTWPIVGASLFATNIGAEHLVGLSGDSYRYGLKAGTVELGTAICIGIACWVLFPTYIENKVFTIPEYLGTPLRRACPAVLLGPDAADLHHDQDGLHALRRSAGPDRTCSAGTS